MREFYFLITYFKLSGKYYTAALVKWKCRKLNPKNEPTVGAYAPIDSNEKDGTAYIHDAVARLRGLRDMDGDLPGLSGAGWDGPIHIQPAQPVNPGEPSNSADDYYGCGLPHILMPRL